MPARSRIPLILAAAMLSTATALPAAAASPTPNASTAPATGVGMEGLPPSHELALFDSTYASLADRVTARGYAPTSLTGYYGAMYTRDSSVNALALLLGGDDAKARSILRYIFRYSAASGAPRMPHRIYRESDTLAPSGEQPDAGTPVASLGGPVESAAQEMPAPALVTATDVWLSRSSLARGSVNATLFAGSGSDAEIVDRTSIPVDSIPDGGGWVTFKFLPPMFSSPPTGGYTLELTAPDAPPGSVTWDGTAQGTGLTVTGSDGRQHAVAGEGAFRERVTDFHIAGYDMFDETDQAYSVLLVWARYVRAHPEDRSFVAETWPLVRTYANYYLDTPGYWNADLDLIRNPILDDEGYHNTYDLLTNVFTSQALHELAPIAAGLGDATDATRWSAVSSRIEHGIDANLVTTVDGKPIYGEKYEVNQGNRFYSGYSFANLSPIAVDWYALDRQTMANTLAAYQAHESRLWSGIRMLSSMHDYAFTWHNDWVLTKGLAWEWRFDQQTGDQARIDDLDHFLRIYYPDTSKPISEGWILDSNGHLRITDPGNQEHASWYAVEMLEAYPGLQGR